MQPAFISEECGQSRAYRDLESDSHRNNPGMQPTRLSAKATGRSHGEDSPYFDGWREYDENPYDPMENPSGIIQMGLAENQLSFDLLEDWLDSHPEASSWKDMGCMENVFRELALYQDYHGLPGFRKAMAKFMEELRGNKVEFDPNRIVFTAGATAANELLMFCLADPGDAFLVPSPYYVGFDRDLTWRTGLKIIPVHCCSSDDFQIPKSALEMAYAQADNQLLKVRGLLITNPWNPLGTTLSAKTLKDLLAFAAEKNIHLVCDEIYSGSAFSPPDFVSIAEILAGGNQFSERVHIVCSLSKDLGLPGFRIGTIYSYNNAVVAAARRMSSFCLISSQTQHLLSAMLSDSAFTQKYIAENHRRLRERHRSLVLGLRRAGIGCLKSNAGLFCWADLRHLLPSPNLEGELKLWKYILHHVGLNISPGSSFHCIEPGWFRLCFANMDDLALQLSLKRLQHFVETRTVNTHKSLLAAE